MSNKTYNKIHKNLADKMFFKIYIETKIGNTFDDMLTKNEVENLDKNKVIKILNNDSTLTPENWNAKKDIFFKQRMEKHNSSYTEKEKIKLELELIDKLPNNKNDFKILKYRYKKYLTNIEPQQTEIKTHEVKNEIKKELHNNIFIGNSFEIWQSMFEKFKITNKKRTDVDFMFQIMKYNNLIYENISYKDMALWIDKVYEITFEKIKYTDPKTSANEKRLIIYNDITSK